MMVTMATGPRLLVLCFVFLTLFYSQEDMGVFGEGVRLVEGATPAYHLDSHLLSWAQSTVSVRVPSR